MLGSKNDETRHGGFQQHTIRLQYNKYITSVTAITCKL